MASEQPAADVAVVVTAVSDTHQMEAPQKETSQESQLHRLCADGDVMGVRGILSNSLEYLESIDPKTGLTPMLAAIYASQADVVRELLSAGAYPPPPTVTQDPSILALIYPPSVGPGAAAPFGLPLPFPPTAGEQSMGYYPPFAAPMMGQQEQYGAPSQMFGQPVGRMRRDGKEGGVLPPADQAKQILCRNFPNCRYGAACHFFHPATAPFYAAPAGQHAQPFMPFDPRFTAPQGPRHDGFYGMQVPPPPFVPQSESNSNAFISAAAPSFVPLPLHDSTALQHIPSADSPPFVPGVNVEKDTAIDATVESKPMDAALPAVAAATHLSAPAAPFAPRAPQPFFNPAVGVAAFDRKPNHIKKASMNGGRVGPSARQMLLGTWNQGQPPACVFFLANKCRNGDMCKFPHILPDGSDCRHPDVINGTIPSAPISAGGPRGPKPRAGMVNGFYGGNGGGNTPQQLHAMQRMQAMHAAAAAGKTTTQSPINASKTEEKTTETASGSTSLESSTADVSSPDGADQPSQTLQTSPPATGSTRASSRPGTTRSVPNTRAHSPTHSTASYGAPRGGRFGGRAAAAAASQPANGGTASSRSTSIPATATKQPKQRVPGAEEFPALSGSTGSLGGESVKPVAPTVVVNGKTAAQVLSEPAIPRAIPETVKPVVVAEAAEERLVRTLSGSSSIRGVSTQSDDDAVVISQLPVTKPAATRPEGVKSGISFASIASSARETVSAAIDAATAPSLVSLQA